MWFASAPNRGRNPVPSTKTAPDLRNRKCDRGHADPI